MGLRRQLKRFSHFSRKLRNGFLLFASCLLKKFSLKVFSFTNLKLECSDSLTLPFQGNSLSRIFYNEVFDWWHFPIFANYEKKSNSGIEKFPLILFAISISN